MCISIHICDVCAKRTYTYALAGSLMELLGHAMPRELEVDDVHVEHGGLGMALAGGDQAAVDEGAEAAKLENSSIWPNSPSHSVILLAIFSSRCSGQDIVRGSGRHRLSRLVCSIWLTL